MYVHYFRTVLMTPQVCVWRIFGWSASTSPLLSEMQSECCWRIPNAPGDWSTRDASDL